MALRSTLCMALSLALAGASLAQEAEPPGAPQAREIDRASTAFNEDEIRKLYTQTKQKKEERAEQLPSHLSDRTLEYYQLKPLLVEGVSIEIPEELKRILDPDHEERMLERIDQIDPVEANIVRYQERTDKEFMMGAYDHRGIRGRHEAPLTPTLSAEQIARGAEKVAEFFNLKKEDSEEEEEEGAEIRGFQR